MAAYVAASLCGVFWKTAYGGSKPNTMHSSALSAVVFHAPLRLLLLQIVVFVVVAGLAGGLMRRIGRSPVISDMFAGMAPGPSLLGGTLPSAWSFLFPICCTGMNAPQMLNRVEVFLCERGFRKPEC